MVKWQFNNKIFLVKSAILFLVTFLFIHFIADVLDKLNQIYNLELVKFNRYLKALFIIFTSLYSFFYFYQKRNEIKKRNFLLIVIWILLFYKSYYFGFSETFFRYCFWIMILPFFLFLKENLDSPYYRDKVYLLFKVLILINSIGVLIGVLYSSRLFLTYYGINSYRFGVSGFLLNQMQLPYFYLAALYVFFSKKKYLLFSLTLLLSVISGVKAIYLGVFFFFIFKVFFFQKHLYSRKTKIRVFLLILLMGGLCLYFILSTRLFLDVISNYGFVSAVFSLRDLNLIATLNELNRNNFNFLIGVIGDLKYRTEFGFLDVFFFFGLLGVILYSIVLRKIYTFLTYNRLAISYLIINLIIVALAGNFFYFPINCLYFSTVLLFLYKNNEKLAK